MIAAGAVPLAMFALVVELRMRQWSLGPRFAVVALIAGFVLLLGWLAPLESSEPRAYHSVLLVCGLLPLGVALVLLAEVLGSSRPPGAGGLFWAFAAEAGVAWAAARRANSAVCTLIAAVALGVAVETFVIWLFKPQGLGTFRAVLVVLALGYGFVAVRLRDHKRRHAVMLINAAGLATLVLVETLAALGPIFLASPGGIVRGAGVAFGWKLWTVAVGLGLVAYAAVDQEPGPAYIGTLVLLSFVSMVAFSRSGRGTLVGWPLFLLALGGAGLVVGLRPRRDLPPPPEASVAPTVPFAESADD